jgi:hypothetical protein
MHQTYRLWGIIQWRDGSFLWSSDWWYFRKVDLAWLILFDAGLTYILDEVFFKKRSTENF